MSREFLPKTLREIGHVAMGFRAPLVEPLGNLIGTVVGCADFPNEAEDLVGGHAEEIHCLT